MQERIKAGESMWSRLFSADGNVPSVSDLLDTLRDPYTEDWKRLPLALLIIVYGVVIPSIRKLRITKESVALVDDVDYFLSFPWGRKSFLSTFTMFGPHSGSNNSSSEVESLIAKFTVVNNPCYGFPLPLQLLALENIPLLRIKVPAPDDMSTFLENPSGCTSSISLLSQEDIARAESDPEVHAISNTPYSRTILMPYYSILVESLYP